MSPITNEAVLNFWESDAQQKQRLGLFSKRGGINYFTIKDEGEYEVRILALGNFYSGSHWGVLEGREGRNGGTVKCPKAFDGSPCPVCELVETLGASQDGADQKQAKDLQVQLKYPVLLLDLNEQGDPTPRIYEAPKTVFGGIVKWLNPKFKYGNILDLEEGRNVTIVRSRNNKNFVEYEVIPDPDRSAIALGDIDMPVLEDVLKPRSYEDIVFAMENGTYPKKQESEEDVEEVVEPKRVLKGRTTTKAPEPAKRKPTTYGKGLPQTKVKDELKMKKLGDLMKDHESAEVEPKEAAAEPEEVATPAPSLQSVKDRLAAIQRRNK